MNPAEICPFCNGHSHFMSEIEGWNANVKVIMNPAYMEFLKGTATFGGGQFLGATCVCGACNGTGLAKDAMARLLSGECRDWMIFHERTSK